MWSLAKLQWMSSGQPTRCEVVPSVHAFERMEERGLSYEEMLAAVLKGSKERKEDDEYLGTHGVCKVKVIERPCMLIVATVMIES